jgi:hypothetical protein
MRRDLAAQASLITFLPPCFLIAAVAKTEPLLDGLRNFDDESESSLGQKDRFRRLIVSARQRHPDQRCEQDGAQADNQRQPHEAP